MKNTNIKKKILIIITMFLILNSKVYASENTSTRTEILIDGQKVYKIYDKETKEDISGDGAILRLNINGTEHIGYCIEIGVNVSTGSLDTPSSLKDYFKNALSETAANTLINKITQYTKFGYGTKGKTTDKYYLATQQLIWQAINETGFYKSDFYKTRAGKTYDFRTIDWTIDWGATTIDLSNEIANIQNSIKNYYKTPSFCSSQNQIELEVGEKAEYTDNNNVLSEYQVTCENGVTCEKKGNKLIVEATGETGNYQISFTKSSNGSQNMLYRKNNTQGIIIDEGNLEPVSCEFGVDTFKNVKTADTKIVYIITIGLFCGIMSYIAYYTKKSLNELK